MDLIKLKGISNWPAKEAGNARDLPVFFLNRSFPNYCLSSYHDLAKQLKLLFIFSFLFFSFLLSWTYYTEKSVEKCYITSVTSHSHITGSHSITLYDVT